MRERYSTENVKLRNACMDFGITIYQYGQDMNSNKFGLYLEYNKNYDEIENVLAVTLLDIPTATVQQKITNNLTKVIVFFQQESDMDFFNLGFCQRLPALQDHIKQGYSLSI